MIYYKIVDFIPKIPDNLLKSLDEIETYENAFPYKDYADTYASYIVNDDLTEWIQNYFDKKMVVRYQVIKKILPIHVDIGIKGIKYNYLLETGGEAVKTRFWDSVENPTKILFETISKKNEWHYLNIEVPHDISEVSSPRISVIVRESL
jgi:hypothetical protein